MNIQKIKLGERLVCPVCLKEFDVTEDTNYIANGGYTCGWKCFLKHVREIKEDNTKVKKKQLR